MDYPSYFRNKGRSVKVISATKLQIIALPPDVEVAERFTTNFPDGDRLTAWISDRKMQPSDEAKWKEFESTFRRHVKSELDDLNAVNV